MINEKDVSNDEIKVIKMEAGEVELRKAFEEVTIKNVQTVINYSKDTRDIVRTLETNIKHLQNNLLSANTEISQLKTQLSIVQAKLFAGGTV